MSAEKFFPCADIISFSETLSYISNAGET